MLRLGRCIATHHELGLHGMGEPAAFRWLQKAAMDQRVSMRDVAETLLRSTAQK